MDKEYILKHKNTPVMLFKLNDDFELSETSEVFNEERLPFGLKYKGKEKAQFIQLSDWIKNRGLPRERSDLANIELDMNAKNSVALLFGSYALNLTDHYWVHKSDVDLKWNDVNFFENEFKEVVNFDFTGVYEDNRNIQVAPDLTVDGSLRKKWVISDGGRHLIKGSRYDEMQEPFNEVIASKIMKLLGIENTPYGLVRNKSNNIPLSICKCMVNRDTEYITARVVRDTEPKNDRNDYDRFIQICEKKGIKDAKEKIDDMIAVDFIIGNTDRHTGNFGIIRNADNLEWLKIAPIFDNGNSLCHNVNKIDSVENNVDSRCRWLDGGNLQKLDYINYPEWYSANKMKDISSLVYDSLKYNEKTNEDKRKKLVAIIEKRVKIFDNKLHLIHQTA
jgi:Zn-finger nucleic acid-binding protein